ncbi:MAG: 3-dehydroquinate synthase II [Gammaproteobacteria bacterium]|nr:MAG: 3-dehydroquinate synthase II [Gammaproteobacteria bacterium]
MKKFWYWAEPFDKKAVTTALESGVDAIVLPNEEYVEEVKKLAKVKVIAPSEKADLRLCFPQKGDNLSDCNVAYVKIEGKSDEELAARLPVPVIIETTDWTIIPLENILAQKRDVYMVVTNTEEAKTAITTLEIGAEGVVLKTLNLNTIKEVGSAVKEYTETLTLTEVEITKVLPLGLGDRVCVDTTSLLKRGEGMLVGNSSAGMFLVHAETEENPYVASRPFRVNAGAVHMYIRVPENKTKYLCEVEAGVPVMVYNYKGEGRLVYVGRAKVERRPMLLIEGKTKEGKKVSAILQNAETIRLTKPNGEPISVVDLKPGDVVLGYTEEAGRHFGMKIKETITEK